MCKMINICNKQIIKWSKKTQKISSARDSTVQGTHPQTIFKSKTRQGDKQHKPQTKQKPRLTLVGTQHATPKG